MVLWGIAYYCYTHIAEHGERFFFFFVVPVVASYGTVIHLYQSISENHAEPIRRTFSIPVMGLLFIGKAQVLRNRKCA